MHVFRIGTKVKIVMTPDGAVFTGFLTDWDDVAIYVNGLGFPRENIFSMEPSAEV